MYGVAGGKLHASGQLAGAPRGARATLQVGSGRKARARGRVRVRRGRFAIAWRLPKGLRAARVRVVVTARGRRAPVASGRWRTIDLRGVRSARPPATVPSRAVLSAPPAGQPGDLRIDGNARLSPGQVVALGRGAATPDGLLARVTAVTRVGGDTVAATVPATLTEAIPSGSLDLGLPAQAMTSGGMRLRAGGLGQRVSRAVSCEGRAQLTASGAVGLTTGLRLEADWHLGLRPRVDARFEGTVRASAELAASVDGAASCTLDPVALLPRPVPLGVYTFSIGPVPVVLKPQAQLYLSADGEVRAGVSTNVSASVTANAGVEYRDRRFRGFGGLRPAFTFQPPALSASGSLQARLTPTVDVLVYGVAGPRIDLNAGLKLQADPAAEPWWKLTAPMDLGAQLRLDAWLLHADSPRFVVWSAEPQIAAAAPGTAPAPPAPPPPPPPPAWPPSLPANRAHMTWDSDADVDLHVWDESGAHTYFSQLTEIPDARLIVDVIDGYGPEDFVEDAQPGRRYTYGLCVYGGDGATVTLDLTDPGGATRQVTRTLEDAKSAALVTVSPAGAGTSPSPVGAATTIRRPSTHSREGGGAAGRRAAHDHGLTAIDGGEPFLKSVEMRISISTLPRLAAWWIVPGFSTIQSPVRTTPRWPAPIVLTSFAPPGAAGSPRRTWTAPLTTQ